MSGLIPLYVAVVLGLIAAQIAEAERPHDSPPWRGRVTHRAHGSRNTGWRPAGRWVSIAGPNRVTPDATGTESGRRV